MQAGARMRKNRTASRRDVVLYPGSGPPATGLYILLTAPRGACRFCASGDENRTSVRPSSLGVASALSGHRVPRTVRLSEHARTPRELVVRCTPGARGGLRGTPPGGALPSLELVVRCPRATSVWRRRARRGRPGRTTGPRSSRCQVRGIPPPAPGRRLIKKSPLTSTSESPILSRWNLSESLFSPS